MIREPSIEEIEEELLQWLRPGMEASPDDEGPPGIPAEEFFILQEDGDPVLQEDGSGILLEEAP